MTPPAEQVLCRFQVSSRARHGGAPLYEWIVRTARREGLRGATVLEGFHGLRADGAIQHEATWTLSQDLPVVVEVVDEAARIERLLAVVEPAFVGGTITLERALVLTCGQDAGARPADDVPVAGEARPRGAASEVRTMRSPEPGVLLRIFFGESDREPGTGRPLYEAIVLRAREAGLAGATVLKGPLGFGRHSRLHAATLLDLSTDLPIIVEIVDAEAKVEAFLPAVESLVREGLVTLERVGVIRY